MLKKWGWLSLLVIVLDQLTKYLAETLLVMHQPTLLLLKNQLIYLEDYILSTNT